MNTDTNSNTHMNTNTSHTLYIEFVLRWTVGYVHQIRTNSPNQDEFLKIKPGLGNLVSVGNTSGIWTPDLYIYRLKSFKMR